MKAYLVCCYIDVGNLLPVNLYDYLESVKTNLNLQETLSDLLNSHVECLFIPTRSTPTKIEIHEFFIDELTNKLSYTISINKNNINTEELINNLKVILNAV